MAIISYASVGDYSEGIVSVYPNPAVDRVQVTSKEMINTIQIIGLYGGVVYQITPQQKDIAIGIDDLKNGLYIISIETESGITREKLIIN